MFEVSCQIAGTRNVAETQGSRLIRAKCCSLFFGKTKVMAVALGLSLETEPYPNTSKLSLYLTGNVGLLFSPRSPQAIQSYFANFQPVDFARSGTAASRDFTIPAGIVYSRAGEVAREDDVPLAHSIEPVLRKLGVPSSLIKGRIHLENDFAVCRKGDVLGSGQTTLLKMFGVATASFVVETQAYYERDSATVYAVQPGSATENREFQRVLAP